jgi:hypothetical protein
MAKFTSGASRRLRQRPRWAEKARCFLALARVLFISLLFVSLLVGSFPACAADLPPLPPAWPYTTLELGIANPPPSAPGSHYGSPFGFRYQYLSGGANTGKGWSNWKAGGGSFVTDYMREAIDDRLMPVFTYYQLYQSLPSGGAGDEAAGDLGNLDNVPTMRAYFEDLKLFFQKASTFPGRVVLHVEPDLWGIMEQRYGDDAASTPVRVSATGMPELTQLPNNGVGFAQAFKRLRDANAPNVYLAYHMSVWGTGSNIVASHADAAKVTADATRAAGFYKSLGTRFDLTFSEFTDRDAAFYQVAQNNRSRWYGPQDLDNLALWIATFVNFTGNRLILWQIPVGNQVMRAMNNAPGHYQDTIVQTFLSDSARARLAQYADAGVIGLLFGAGAMEATCPCDAMRDGVTDPAPINGNTTPSYNADDDGGYLIHQAQAYYQARAMTLPSSAPQ